MKHFIKRAFNRITPSVVNELELERGSLLRPDEPVAQKNLMQNYRLLAALAPQSLPSLSEVGFRKYSQFEEDGMLLYIFSLIPTLNRTCVEICAGDGRENMTSNLIINHGWRGHLFDGNSFNVEAGKRFDAQDE